MQVSTVAAVTYWSRLSKALIVALRDRKLVAAKCCMQQVTSLFITETGEQVIEVLSRSSGTYFQIKNTN